MKRPLVGIAVMFCIGIAAGEWLGLPLAVLWMAFGAAFVASLLLLPRKAGLVAVHASLLLGGLLAHRLANTYPQPCHLVRLLADRPQNAVVRARITVEPVRMMHPRVRGPQERDFFFARVRELDRGDGWERAAGDVVVWLDQPPADGQLHYGDEIEFRALMRHPSPPANPGLFDYPAYLARCGVYYEARIHSAAMVTVVGHQGAWWMEAGMWVQRRFLASVARGLDTRPAGDEAMIIGLLRAMLVGFRPGLTNELAEPFMRTGTLHVFAVSGLHVAVIAGLLVGLLRFCRMGRMGCALLALPLLLFYTLATGAPASAVRAFLMTSILIIGWSLPRPAHLLNSLAASAIVILLYDPMQLFDAGFQLSYAAVLAIALLVPGPGFLAWMLYRRDEPKLGSLENPDSATVWPRVPGWLPDIFVCDPYLPTRLIPRWRRAWYAVVRGVYASFAVSVASFIGTMPLIAHYFHLFTAINFLSNLVIVPLSTMTIVIGFAAFVSDVICQPLAVWLNNANYGLMELMLLASRWFERVPFAFVYVRTPPLWLSALFYLVLGGFLWAGVKKMAHRLRWLGAVALCALAIGLAARNGEQTTTLSVLNVGDGEAVFVGTPAARHDALIDCGPAKSADFVLRPFLRAQGCAAIETLILTHPDANHLGAIGTVLDDFHPRRIFDNGQSRWTRLPSGLLPGFQASRLVAGATLPLGAAAELRVLYPAVGRLPSVADNAALVLQLRCGLHRVLLASDIGATVERTLVASGVDLRSDVLVKGLHAREDSCTDDFLDAVAPQWVVISAGENTLEQPAMRTVLERIQVHGAQWLSTGRNGGVTIHLGPDDLDVKSFWPVPATVIRSAGSRAP